MPRPASRKKAADRPDRHLVVAISGASGAVYAVRLLEALRALGGWRTHLVMTDAGALTAWDELGMKRRALERLADVAYHPKDLGAAIASGSFLTEGMIIAPCSMKTLASVAHGFGDDLVTRAADVTLKERRRLVLIPREAPLNLAHLRNMAAVTEMGGVVFPPVPAFYAKPRSLDDVVMHTVARVLDLFGVRLSGVPRWSGLKREG
jgi:polyprenyl P-hydroxybenzoate/phenylacrylic acid decarboxylase-like protein